MSNSDFDSFINDFTILYDQIKKWLIKEVELYKLYDGVLSIYSIDSNYIIIIWINQHLNIFLKVARPTFFPDYIVNQYRTSFKTERHHWIPLYFSTMNRNVEEFENSLFKIEKDIRIKVDESSTFVHAYKKCIMSFDIIPENPIRFIFDIFDYDKDYYRLKDECRKRFSFINDDCDAIMLKEDLYIDFYISNKANFKEFMLSIFKYIDKENNLKTEFIENLRKEMTKTWLNI